ncbi:MAG: aminoacyl-tRNA hydrolase, partial [Streptosporangiaceae bacterium]
TGDDHVLARDLAGQAGQRLLELRAQGGDPDVLRDFSAAERKDLPFFIDRAADATEALIAKGLAGAQNTYHEELSG